MKNKLNRWNLKGSPVSYIGPTCLPYIKDIATESMGKFDFDVFLPEFNMNLQRPFVWTLEQKQKLVLSILCGNEIPSCAVIYSYGKDRYEVIDGKQRILSLVSFYNNEFPIEVNGEEYYFDDLAEDLQYRIRCYNFTAYIHYVHDHRDLDDKITDREKIAWFLYINNTGTPQQDEYLKKLEQL